MFDNIGSKLKTVAQVATWLGIIGSVVTGLTMLDGMIGLGILTIIVGSLVSWLGSMALYGLGQLIENTDKLVAQKNASASSPSSAPAPAKSPTAYTPAPPTTPPAPKLGSLEIPKGTTRINAQAYANRTDLSKVHIPDSVTIIGDKAFYGCTSLTSVIVRRNLLKIEKMAFANCHGLTSITYLGTKAEWRAISKGDYWKEQTGSFTVYCFDGEISKADS